MKIIQPYPNIYMDIENRLYRITGIFTTEKEVNDFLISEEGKGHGVIGEVKLYNISQFIFTAKLDDNGI